MHEYDERVRPTPKKKNTKIFCKGVSGRHHQPELKYTNQLAQFSMADCKEFIDKVTSFGNRPPRNCLHQECCASCGKILKSFVRIEDCPDIPKENNDGGSTVQSSFS